MKKAIVLGLGISGKSVVNYLKSQHFQVYEVDKHNEHDPLVMSQLQECDFLVKSPGISWNHPLVVAANGKVTSEIELACKALVTSSKKILAITGSNGKTTTTMLTAHVLNHVSKKAKKNQIALACGNIGLPLLSCIHADAEILVVELSSYQLEGLETKAIDAAVILNITANHLDRYSSFQDYAHAKLRMQNVLKNSGKLFLSEEIISNFAKPNCYHEELPKLKVEENVASIFSLRYRDGRFSHDYQNFCAAFALCREMGVAEHAFWEACASFVKPPHRLEFVKNVKGVRYINDSKATSVDAVIKGVDAIDGALILIAGGVDKGGSYHLWNVLFKDKVKKVILFGQAKWKIYEEIRASLDAEIVDTLPEALDKAACYARNGECVLFSPGCSSYDQFTSFEHRGDVFKTLVGKL